MSRHLTPREARFIEEYLIDLNGTQAAIRAGYSEASARQRASELLCDDDVSAAIATEKAARSARTKITADMVLQELARIGFANMLDYISIGANGDPFVDLSSLTPEQAAAIGEVTVEDFVDGRGEAARDVKRVKFRLNDKIRALVEIGKHIGVAQRHEVTGKGGAPIALNVDLDPAIAARKLAFLFTLANRQSRGLPVPTTGGKGE